MVNQHADEKIAYSVPVIVGTVATATWVITPAGPTITGQQIVDGDPQAIIGGMTAGVAYEIHVHCVMSDGQERDSRMSVRCIA